MVAAGTLWRTVRHLKPRQFTGRLAFRLGRPQLNLATAPALRAWSGPWALPAGREASLLAPGRFRFLNAEGYLAELGWVGSGAEKLWRYNQHYFDDLNALGADTRRAWHQALLAQWLKGNPPGRGDGWEPYPTSLRIVNWIKAAASGLPLGQPAVHCLAVQARWLMQRLEWHLLGNHLFANAKALVLAGLFFKGPEAQRWFRQGMAILAEQLPEQVLIDGGQFERSPMYHALALEDMLDLINAARAIGNVVPAPTLNAWEETASRMLRWMRVMTHSDGRLAQFNDSAHGIAPDGQELERYARVLGVTAEPCAPQNLTYLHESGYVRADWSGAALFCDVAPVGPDYLPGHAHADTLSFELSIASQRIVVNGGTSCYGASPRRVRERGTAAHSTVQVAGLNSSEVWSGFRVGRRAYPRDVRVEGETIQASHDGYAWLPGRPVHTRTWQTKPNGLTVSDTVTGAHAALARYQLAPGLTAKALAEGKWAVFKGVNHLAHVEVPRGRASIQPSRQSPEFGLSYDTQCLTIELDDGRAQTNWSW